MSYHFLKHQPALRYLVVIICLLLASSTIQAQEIIDKLKAQYQSINPDNPERFLVAGKYITALFFNQQEEKADSILSVSLNRSIQQKDGKYTANLYAIDALNKRIKEDIYTSKKSLLLAQQFAAKSTDTEIKGFVKYCEGWIYVRDNIEGEAVRCFLDALNLYSKASKSNTLNTRKSAVYKELTSIYANWNELELQEKYSTLALGLAIEEKDAIAIFDAYMLKGHMYEKQYAINESATDLRSRAEKYYLLAIDTYQNNKDKIPFPSNLSFVANNLAYLYLSFNTKQHLEKAQYYAELALKQGRATQQYTHSASAYGIMAEIALEDKNTYKAKEYLLNALYEISKSGTPDQNIFLSIYESLSEIAESENNLSEAIKYHKAYMEVYKAVHNQEQIELGRRLEAQYEKERQQQQLLNMQLESDKQEQQIRLINSVNIQQQQEYENLKLHEENQRKKLELSQLESEKRTQELKLSRLETESRAQDILNYKNEINYKEKINTYYVSLILVFGLVLLLLLYAYKQRSKTIKQNKKLYHYSLDQERQNTKIATLTAMLDGQESERGRMARDLHDGLGGILSSTKINLSQLNDQVPESTQKDLQKSLIHIDLAVTELRKIAHNLMPDLLDRYGLQIALKDYAKRMSNNTLEVSTQFLNCQSELQKEKQLLVYRIIQELVNNAIKHADATNILIQIVEEKNHYEITVEDDGKGFNLSRVKGNHSTGLYNIQSRIDFLKGELKISSEINIGTTIEIDFPKTYKA